MANAQPQALAAQPQTQQPSNGQLTSPTQPPKKEKDPKRVAAGKAIAEKTKQAREAQKKELEDSKAQLAKYKEREAAAAASATTVQEPASDSPKDTGGISFGTVLAVGGLIVGAAGVYYQREAIQERLQFLATRKKESAPSTPPVASEPAPAPKKKGEIRKMD